VKNMKQHAIRRGVALSLLMAMSLALVAVTPSTSADAVEKQILVFSKDPFTDSDEEDAEITGALRREFGEANVTIFDGGDGTAAAWSAALAGKDVLVLPESDQELLWVPGRTSRPGGGPSTEWPILDEAMAVIRTWAKAGRLVIGTGSYSHLDIVEFLTETTFSEESFGYFSSDYDEPWVRAAGLSTDLPATLPTGNYTGGIDGFADYTAGEKAVIQPLYVDVQGSDINVGVARFRVGSGAYLYLAYDWYPDSSDRSVGGIFLEPEDVGYELTVTGQWNFMLTLGAGGALTPDLGTSPGTTQPSGGSQPLLLPSGELPALLPGEAGLVRQDGSQSSLVRSTSASNQVRYSGDGLVLTLTGEPGSGGSGGLVADRNGEVSCEVCAFLADGGVIEAWVFSEPRLVAAHRAEDFASLLAGLPCQRFMIPVGAPLDGLGSLPTGAHTLQLQLPTNTGMQVVNVGFTIGQLRPVAVRAGEGAFGDALAMRGAMGLVMLVGLGALVVRRGRRSVSAH
jgi:hypothetical protein